MSSSLFVSQIFKDSCSLAYTGIGYNFMFGHSHLQDGTFTDRVINVSKLFVLSVQFLGLYFSF